nr:MAG TPA: tail collar fiber protein [Caudoviricetes sp.]
MKNTTIKGTGNSRWLKTSLPAGATWEQVLTLLRSGQFPVDITGLNTEGVQAAGTALDKETLLRDAICDRLGLDKEGTVPSDVFELLIGLAGVVLTITFEAAFQGKTFTVTDSAGTTVYTHVVGAGLVHQVTLVKLNETYTVSCPANDGYTYTDQVTTGPYFGFAKSEMHTFLATLTVICGEDAAGASVAATLGDYSVTGTIGSNGQAVLTLRRAGTYTVTATKGSETRNDTVAVTQDEGSYSVSLPFRHIYGISWDGTSTTKCSRTDDAELFVDPAPYVSGASSYGSPFDSLMPWSGMEIVEDDACGTLVKIPKFWYKLTQNGNGIKIQIADAEADGFSVSPAHMDRGDGAGVRDVVYVGRYHCGGSYKSTAGSASFPATNITRANFRKSIHNLGTNVWQWDWAIHLTIQLLYIVEFADWNSQKCIGYGCGNGSSVQAQGASDNMPYHTGTMQAARTTYGVGVQYRHIEGLWDNLYDWVDGCYYNSSGLNLILNPASFSDSSGGTPVGVPSNGYPSALGVKTAGPYPVFIPTAAAGSDSTYVPDSWFFGASYPCLYVGGDYYQSLYHGLFYVYYNTASYSHAGIGSRLQKLP